MIGERGKVRELWDLGERTEVGFPTRDAARGAVVVVLARLGFLGLGIVSIDRVVISSFSLSEAMWKSSMLVGLLVGIAGRVATGADLAGLAGLLEELWGIGGRGWLWKAGKVVVIAVCTVGKAFVSGAVVLRCSVFSTVCLLKSWPMVALRKLMGIRFMRRSMRDLRSVD